MTPIQSVITMLILSFVIVLAIGAIHEAQKCMAFSVKIALYWLIIWSAIGFAASAYYWGTYKPAPPKQSYIGPV